MTTTRAERVALYAAGLSAIQVNRLTFYRSWLYRYGHGGNRLATPDVLRARIGG